MPEHDSFAKGLKVVDPGYVQMSHGLGPMEKLRVTEQVHWKRTVIVRWGCWWKLYGNIWAVSDLCLEVIGTEPSSGYLKDPAAVAMVIANRVPVDLVADYWINQIKHLHKHSQVACVIFNLVPNYKLHKTNEPYGTHFPIISIFNMFKCIFDVTPAKVSSDTVDLYLLEAPSSPNCSLLSLRCDN
ncbi:hypothetical protein BY996DRAFT_6422903 [Phakopsora pachyrhizi]|nr:hypothetical protein BY996DRAFT_6422903 [Phakopsora pachyrhizi]